jgi:hypothetical protein
MRAGPVFDLGSIDGLWRWLGGRRAVGAVILPSRWYGEASTNRVQSLAIAISSASRNPVPSVK